MSLATFEENNVTDASLPAGSDGLVYVSTARLIQLHHAAQSLPLKVAKVRALQTGQYYSPFRGRGMEFDEVRLYQSGDDIRTLDWRVTARTGKAHTKLFREERERSVIVWVDYRPPMFFATRGVFKSVLASQTAALLAWSAHHQRDRIGGLIFAENQHHELRPRGGKSAVLHLLQLLSQMSSLPLTNGRSSKTSAAEQQAACYQALVRLRRVAKPGSLIFLISDFRDFDRQAESVLTQITQHNDVILLLVSDPLEELLPDAGIYRVGNEQQVLAIDTSNDRARQSYATKHRQKVHDLKNMCMRHRMGCITLSTQDDVLEALRTKLYLTFKTG
ncbi:MAG TPA: DUF58 domain-containing protein [Gammaproteobacteria bacterium]